MIARQTDRTQALGTVPANAEPFIMMEAENV